MAMGSTGGGDGLSSDINVTPLMSELSPSPPPVDPIAIG